MPMSPRLKMRRGRFGPGGFKAPRLTITSPANNSSLNEGGSPTILFTATAFDDLQGDISSSIVWFVGPLGSPNAGFGSPQVAVGASVDLTAFLTFGSPQAGAGSPATTPNTVYARSTDAGGKSSTVSIIVYG